MMKLSERIHGWLISRMIDGYYKVSDSEIKVALDEATQLEAESAALKRELRALCDKLEGMVNNGEPHEMGGPFIDGGWVLKRVLDVLMEADDE